MSNVIPFPRPPLPPEKAHPVLGDRCKDPLHLFAELPGRCQCGAEVWVENFEGVPFDGTVFVTRSPS